MRHTLFCLLAMFACRFAFAQDTIRGRVFDNETKEPLVGATVLVAGTTIGSVTDLDGRFSVKRSGQSNIIEISFVGYEKLFLPVDSQMMSVALTPSTHNLQQVVVTASREATLRTETPVAISKLSATEIQDTKPVLMTELLNKIPGVVMLNYNNEQHAMAIRQPMGTSAYFLYMEDGLPLRPMGVFNHNALIETNIFNISSIEVVKGPASSVYGPEAVGGAINIISHRPTAIPTVRIGVQGDQWGYKRLQYGGGGMVSKKLGFYIGGFEAVQRNGWQTFSDYDKSSINARLDYTLTKKTKMTLAFSGNEYYSDMTGSVDSVSFYRREYSSTTDFTYRKVHSQRTRLTVSHQWNKNQETQLTLGYRDNYIEQNPNYAIRWVPGSTIASGEINRNTFFSKIGLLQHSARFNFLDARLLAGTSIDLSPTHYWSYKTDLSAKLRTDGKSVERYTVKDVHKDEFIAKYTADLRNIAMYTQIEMRPFARLKVTAGIRYDHMFFVYRNFLQNATGSKAYRQITPKVGVTYDLENDKGLYANYSQGFSPPGLTAIFRKKPSSSTSTPAEFYYNLEPARFDNFEIGGWASLLQNRIYLDAAAYQMIGHKELLSIRQADNSTDYQSAGKTLHRGVEYGISYIPSSDWLIRFGGTNAVHRFEEFLLSNRDTDEISNVNGNDMPQAPRWIANGEVTYKPSRLKGFRIAMEWQHIGSWYQDQVNRIKYDDKGFLGLRGISCLNVRAGYAWKSIEVFTNIMNLTDELYANSATRGNTKSDRTSFTAAAPRTFVMGVQYNFNGKPKK